MLSQEHLTYGYLAPESVFAFLPQCGLPGSLAQTALEPGLNFSKPGLARGDGIRMGSHSPPPCPGPEDTEGLECGTKNVQGHPDSDPVCRWSPAWDS